MKVETYRKQIAEMHLESAIENILQAERIAQAVGVNLDPSRLIHEIERLKASFAKPHRPFIQINWDADCPLLVEVV